MDTPVAKALVYAPYQYGSYFVATVIDQMERQGKTRAEAVKMLLLDPPMKLGELERPEDYIYHLLWENRFSDSRGIDILETAAKIFLCD